MSSRFTAEEELALQNVLKLLLEAKKGRDAIMDDVEASMELLAMRVYNRILGIWEQNKDMRRDIQVVAHMLGADPFTEKELEKQPQ